MRMLLFVALLLIPSLVFAQGMTGYDIAKGRDGSFRGFWKFGFNADISTVEETVWDQGGLYEYIATAATLNVSSSSAADTAGGTGASNVEVSGLDENFKEISETLTLNGQTAVVTTNKFIRVFRMKITGSATADASFPTNAGDVYAGLGGPASGVPTTPYAKILAGEGQTLMSVWTVPETSSDGVNILRACLEGLFTTTAGNSNTIATIRLIAREASGAVYTPFQIKDKFIIAQAGGATHIEHQVPICFKSKTDIEVRGTAGSGTIDISGGMQFIIMYP